MLTEHDEESEVGLDRLQLPLGLKETEPVGGVAPELAMSVTVAVHVVA
jgi:hypothetical protein